MRWLLACLGLLLCWPAFASSKTTRTVEVECIPEADVKIALDSGKISRMGMGLNDNEEMVILWRMYDGRFWLSWMKHGEDIACTLGAGPVWIENKPGAPS